jgi:hypothetical protein
MAGKEAFGTLEIGVEVGEPVHDRGPRRDGERHIGAGPEPQRLALANEARHAAFPIPADSNSLINCAGMVNAGLMF